MTAATARLVAAMLLLVLTASPVSTLVCVRDCSAAAQRSASTSASEHCLEPKPADSATVGGVAPDGCDLPTVRDVATRERVMGPLGSAPPVTAHQLVVTGSEPSRDMFATSYCVSRWTRLARAAGAPRPLRI